MFVAETSRPCNEHGACWRVAKLRYGSVEFHTRRGWKNVAANKYSTKSTGWTKIRSLLLYECREGNWWQGRAGQARQAGVSRDLNRARVFVDVASGRGKVNRRSERRRCCTRTRSE